MPLLGDRVQESTTTGGTGTLTLAGAVTGYRTFNSVFSNGDVVYYTIDDGAGNWEVGYGTVGTGTLSRSTVLDSSNAGNLVNFAAGTSKRVFCTAPTAAIFNQSTGGTVNGPLTVTGTTTLATSLTGLLKSASGVVSTAISGTDYAPPTSGTSILKGNGSGAFSNATSGTDYAPATSGTSILYGNGSGGFSNVTVGSGISFTGGTLSATGSMVYPGAGIPNSTGSAWGTSYSTTGSGTVVALATSPSFTTPVLGTPTSGTLSNCTVDGTNSVGYLNIPQNAQTGSYTLVAADSGKHIYHAAAAAAATYTIPDNASVAYAIGTAITFINMSTNAVTISITSDTLYLAGAGTTGNRTLAQYGEATAIKVTSTTWLISGVGLS